MTARWKRAQRPSADDVAIPVHTAPGQQAQVDFGYVGKLVDPTTGKRRKAWVFVKVLSHSRLLYAEVVFSHDVETWLALHRRAFKAFGRVPLVVVPDNLKAAVIKAAFSASDMGELPSTGQLNTIGSRRASSKGPSHLDALRVGRQAEHHALGAHRDRAVEDLP
jgi:transposase